MNPSESESEKLLKESIAKLKTEIEEAQKRIDHEKFELGVKKSRLKKLEKALESDNGDSQEKE